jgi:phage baseplate assembly protein gpV
VLTLMSLAGEGEPVDLQWGASLWDARVESHQDGVADRVTAIGWHPQRAQSWKATADGGRGGGEALLVDQTARSEDDVTALARAELDVRAARAVILHATAAGSPRLVAGARVAVRGLGEPADATYVLTTTTHTVDGAGYLTEFTSEPPNPRGRPRATSVTLGTVTSVDDPDHLGRVQVSLPTVGDLDAGWLALLSPGAGAGRGLVVLPAVGDTVMVALPQESPADGVVLGAVYGTKAPPDATPARWMLRTADGQSIVVDDDAHKIRVETRNGSFLELAPDGLRLHAASGLVIDAPGHALTIRAASVDFEHAPLPL